MAKKRINGQASTPIYHEKYDLYLRENTYDEYIAKEMRNAYSSLEVDEDTVLFDMGANIGAFTRKWAPSVKKVYCYEPDENNFKMLQLNTKDLDNVECIRAAVGATDDKERVFYINNQTNSAAHSLFVPRGRDEIRVPAVNFDEEVEKYQPTAIKMDIEGAEYEVIPASKFPSCIKDFIFEIHIRKKAWRVEYLSIEDYLLNAGFKPIVPLPELKKQLYIVAHYKRF
ncbi:MAG: FkbM family methyltransferase [archaeon]